MKQVVSIRIPIKLLNILLTCTTDENQTNRSEQLISLLKNGYLYRKHNCRKLIENAKVEEQLRDQSFLLGVFVGISVTLISSVIYFIIQRAFS